MVQRMLPSRRVGATNGRRHAFVECSPLCLMGCLLPRTSENAPFFLGTWVNKAASVSVYTGGHLFGARERKNEIVGTVAEPRIQRRTSDFHGGGGPEAL